VSRSRISLVAAATLTIVFVSNTASTPASAQDDLRKRGDIACKGDAPRLCKPVLAQGDMAILSCFQQKRKRLSGKCRRFLTEIGQLY